MKPLLVQILAVIAAGFAVVALAAFTLYGLDIVR